MSFRDIEQKIKTVKGVMKKRPITLNELRKMVAGVAQVRNARIQMVLEGLGEIEYYKVKTSKRDRTYICFPGGPYPPEDDNPTQVHPFVPTRWAEPVEYVPKGPRKKKKEVWELDFADAKHRPRLDRYGRPMWIDNYVDRKEKRDE